MATEPTAATGPTAATEPTAASAGPRRAGSQRLRAAGWYTGLTALSVIVLFPIYMLLLHAISDPLSYVARGQPLYPVDVEWDAFTKAFTQADLGRAMGLSFVVTMVIVIAQLLTSTLAAYAFAFLEFPFKRLMFAVVIATLLLPIEVTLVANLQTIRDADLLNSVPGLSLPFLATAFGIFLIRQGFLGIPGELRDAATLDGYGHLRFLFRVAMPLNRPIIGSFVVISFLGAWNQYVWPRFATTEGSWQTVQVALRNLATDRPDQLNIGFAAAIVVSLPLVALLILFQRQIVRGLTAGAVKG
ncbi:MAG: carbohydrate ABC transporter permease [Actinobacteria bacterium]|nr:carbohydrate ABC transporter permease [Actinomycetota bacterium]